MSVHIPHYNPKTIFKFRKQTNKLLRQYEYVGLPLLGESWKDYKENLKTPKAVLLTKKKLFSNLYLLCILECGQASILDLKTSDWYFIGQCRKVVSGAIIMIVDFSKTNTLFGGHITLMDVLVYDDENITDFDFFERFSVTKTIPITFPSRYTQSVATVPEPGQPENLNIYVLS